MNSAPTVTVDASATMINRGATIDLTSTVTDPDNQTITYEWEAPAGTFGNTAVANTTWTAPSGITVETDYDITLTVTDPLAEMDSDTVTITVAPNTAPTVTVLTASGIVEGLESITIAADSSDAENHTLTY